MLENKQYLPKISIITPNFNGGKTLRQTIESVIQQGYPNLEYIIVDGGSTDDSQQIISDYRRHINGVVYSADRTMYDGIAKGFDLATGDVFAWLNSDDMYEPGVLDRVGNYFARHPKRAVVYFEDTVWKQGWRVPNRLQKYIDLRELIDGHILYQDSVFFRRNAYFAVGGLDRDNLRLAGDYQLWLRLASRYRFYLIPGHGSCFRLRPDQLSGDWNAYMGEVAAARNGSLPYLPRFFQKRTEPGRLARKVASKLRKKLQRFSYPISHEHENWSPVTEAPPQPLDLCRCPICQRPPKRLLFSTPDTRFGDRSVRRVYFCATCETAFLFPKPDQAEMAALYERTYSGDIPPVGDPPAGTYSPYQVSSLLKLAWYYDLFCIVFHLLARLTQRLGIRPLPYDDIVPLTERKDTSILEIGCFEGRVLDWFRALGYQNLYGTDFNTKACEVAAAKGYRIYAGDITQTDWPGHPVEAIVLNQLIEHVDNPAEFLMGLKERLTPGGRIYLSTPNLDSIWLKHYGPAWSHWHFPFHQFVTGKRGLRKIASEAGYNVKWIRTNTPIHWAYMSDLLGVRGLGGYVSHNLYEVDPILWRRATGMNVFSWATIDWLRRGDCLHACLIKKD